MLTVMMPREKWTDERLDEKPADELDPENWWGAIDGEILDRLREHGSTSVRELCEAIGSPSGSQKKRGGAK